MTRIERPGAGPIGQASLTDQLAPDSSHPPPGASLGMPQCKVAHCLACYDMWIEDLILETTHEIRAGQSRHFVVLGGVIHSGVRL